MQSRGKPALSWRLTVLALAATLGLPATRAVALEVPYLSGHVNDTAAILTPDVRDRIESKLIDFERTSGAQVAVLTIDSLDGEALEDYSIRVAQTWKLGRKGVDDGVLMLIAKNDHKMRIEVGYGLEGKLPDAICRRILDNILRPRFRAGDFGGGVEAGVDAITGTLQGKDVVPTSTPSSNKAPDLLTSFIFAGFFLVVITPFVVIALFTKGPVTWFLYLFLMPFLAAFPTAILGARALVIVAAWVVGFPIFKLWLHSSGGGKAFLKAHPRFDMAMASTSFHSSSGHSWSSGGGGFSGGGGSFGGGGSSGSW